MIDLYNLSKTQLLEEFSLLISDDKLISNDINICQNSITNLSKLINSENQKKIDDLKIKIDILNKKRTDLRKDYNLPSRYYFSEDKIYNYLKDFRADSLKEAIELLEQEQYQNEIKSIYEQYEQKLSEQQRHMSEQQRQISELQRMIDYQSKKLLDQSEQIRSAKEEAELAYYEAENAHYQLKKLRR